MSTTTIKVTTSHTIFLGCFNTISSPFGVTIIARMHGNSMRQEILRYKVSRLFYEKQTVLVSISWLSWWIEWSFRLWIMIIIILLLLKTLWSFGYTIWVGSSWFVLLNNFCIFFVVLVVIELYLIRYHSLPPRLFPLHLGVLRRTTYSFGDMIR